MNLLIWPLISHLRKRGIMTIYWVCNYEEDFKRAINYGACGIMTDDPPLLD
jgi:glycerophosphoryl diester phosphodiesterase